MATQTRLFEDRSFDQKRAVNSKLWSVDEDYLGHTWNQAEVGKKFLNGNAHGFRRGYY